MGEKTAQFLIEKLFVAKDQGNLIYVNDICKRLADFPEGALALEAYAVAIVGKYGAPGR